MPRLRLSFRTLLSLVLIVAAFFGGLAWQRAADQKEQQRLAWELRELQAANARLLEQYRSALNELPAATEP